MNVLVLLPLAAALAGEHNMVSFGKDVHVPAAAVVQEVVAIGGSVVVEGQVREGVVAIGGPVRVDGLIGDDLVVIGSASLGPRSIVDGDLVVVGGTLDAAPGARVKGQRTTVTLRGGSHAVAWPLGWTGGWLHDSLGKLRPIAVSHTWAWILALGLLLSYPLVTALAPGPVGRCAALLERQPVQALIAGILALTFAGPASLLLVVTVAGIALLPALAGLLLVAAWVGKAGLLLMIGRQQADRMTLPFGAPGLVALAAAELLMFYCVPFIGLPLWGLTTAWGLGAGMLAAFEAAAAEAPARAARPVLQEEKPMTEPLPSVVEERAGFWPRAGAFTIDIFAVSLISAITPVLIFGPFAWALYQIGMWSWKGTTLGGMLLGLRGVRLDGAKMDVSVAVVRHLASYLSAFVCFVGYFWAAWDQEGRTWHDKLAGTIVIRVPKAEPLL